jgi:hypothetical protein
MQNVVLHILLPRYVEGSGETQKKNIVSPIFKSAYMQDNIWPHTQV